MGDLERALSRNTLLLPAIFLAAGIALGLRFELSWIYGLALLLIAIIIYLIILRISTDAVMTFRLRNYHYIWLSVAFCGLGILAYSFRAPKNYNIPTNRISMISGKIIDIKEMTYGDAMIVDINSLFIDRALSINNLKLKVNLIGNGGKLEIGDIINFKGKIRRIEDNPNSFYKGYKAMMNSNGIYYVCDLNEQNLSVIGHKNSLGYYSWIIRNSVEKIIETSDLNKSTQNFLITILLGDRSYLDPDLKTTFSEAGVSHVLALSGMHVAIMGGIFLIILIPINFYGRYKLRYILAAMMLWFYAFISGMSPSTVRACIMITFMTVAIVAERKNYALNALAGSALLILLYSPMALVNAGFQLSVFCVSALILFADALNLFSRSDNKLIYKFAEIVIATVISTFASWILTCYYFHSFPLSFLPANLIILPLLPIYLVIAVIYLVSVSLGFEFTILRHILDVGYDYINRFLEVIGSNSAVELWVSYEAVILWITGLLALALFLNLYKAKMLLGLGALLLIFSVALIAINDYEYKPGSFIITDKYNSIAINVKKSTGENTISLNRFVNSKIRIGRSNIITLDSETLPDNETSRYDYLIIGGSFKGDIIKVAEAFAPATIVIHPSVRRKREVEYINALKSSGYPVHSLRHNKPLIVQVY